MIDPVSSIGGLPGAALLDTAPAGATSNLESLGSGFQAQKPATDFSTWLTQQVEDVNDKLVQADMQVRQLALGEDTNIHQVMIALEKARLSLELVVQVRNKVLDVYQNLMQMQV
jgi:flagellar hook-basal body complex protein FliE